MYSKKTETKRKLRKEKKTHTLQQHEQANELKNDENGISQKNV